MDCRKDRERSRLRSTVVMIGLVAGSYLIALLIEPGATEVAAQETAGAELYAAECASCHQDRGEGVIGTFPPLAGNPAATDQDYVIEVIRDGLSGPLEVLGETYDMEMPAVDDLGDEERAVLAAYVVELAGGTPEPAGPPPSVDAPSAGNPDRGRDLFIGSDRFDNGGGACASCHTGGDVGNLGGWSLGPDLDDVYARFGGEAGLTGWLANPPSQTMAPIFDDDPLTDGEITDLVAFLADAPNRNEPADQTDWLTVSGLIGLGVLIAGMALAWRGMRQTYTQTLRSRP